MILTRITINATIVSMNIFVLSKCPVESARMLCDKHVVKMTLETAQLLCTAHRVIDGDKDNKYPLEDPVKDSILYRATHINHPCSVWVRETPENYTWTLYHFMALLEEYALRYGKVHKCFTLLPYLLHVPRMLDTNDVLGLNSTTGLTEHPLAMPDEYKVPGDPVASYRAYYLGDKLRFARWNKIHNRPDWVPIGLMAKIEKNDKNAPPLKFHDLLSLRNNSSILALTSMGKSIQDWSTRHVAYLTKELPIRYNVCSESVPCDPMRNSPLLVFGSMHYTNWH